MRVSMKYNGIPTPCEAISYGEVEDYTVNIGRCRGYNCPSCSIKLSCFWNDLNYKFIMERIFR
jgi:hypothetical protein